MEFHADKEMNMSKITNYLPPETEIREIAGRLGYRVDADLEEDTYLRCMQICLEARRNQILDHWGHYHEQALRQARS